MQVRSGAQATVPVPQNKKMSCRAGVGAFALFGPTLAPFSFASTFIGFFAGACDGAIFDFAFRCAERQLNMAAMLAGMADNARFCRWRIGFGGDEIRKFFVFITQRAAFQLAMLRCALHTLGEMAPVSGNGHGTCEMMRTGSDDGGLIRNQRRS